MKMNMKKQIRRNGWGLGGRSLLVLSSLVCLVLQGSCGPKEAAGPTLTIASYGGAYQDSQRAAFFEPFRKERNVRLVEVSHAGEYSKLKAMVETGNYEWDVVDAESRLVYRGANEGILERIDYSVVPKDELLPWAVHEYGVANIVYSNIIAYSLKEFPAGKPHPTTWGEFWDVEKFPGRRGLEKRPHLTLEAALLADGVAPEELYPLDVERAFRSLDRLRPSVAVWWDAGAVPPQLLANEEVVLTSAYNGRIWSAVHEENIPIAVEWGQGIMDSDWWVVPRGLPEERRRLAMEFIAFAVRAERQAEQVRRIPYGPTNRLTLDMVPPEMKAHLPTAEENIKKQVWLDSAWWAENEAEVLRRWNLWRLE
jgi:putative spermidine/putrescine transport system substrate-binding protein